MTNAAINKALEDIYASLENNNEGLDALILKLKILLRAENLKSVEVDATKIPQPNRQGRKVMQSYFQKRGVVISFANVASGIEG